MNIVLIGAGNVASHLGPLFQSKGHKIIQLYSRTVKSGLTLSKKLKCKYITDPSELLKEADVYVIALRDEAIVSFLKKLIFIPKLIVHTSGSLGIEVFPPMLNNTGVLYPLQTFSKSNKKKPEKIPFCIEGNNQKSLTIINKLAQSVSALVFKMNSTDRALLHLAAVYVNNFSNYLFIIGEKILHRKKIPFEVLRPLIMETAQKVLLNSPSKMQTGPAQRGDAVIIERHIKLLSDYPEMKEIYSLFTKCIEKDYGPRL